MIEIKFKVTDLENGKVYPSEKIIHFYFENGEIYRVDVSINACEAKALTDFRLLRFADRLDINNKELYEGDSVKFKDSYGKDIFAKVIWNKDGY
ncbi:MAG: hypothetical protein V3U02_12220, partial [Calditrichia bacterium]